MPARNATRLSLAQTVTTPHVLRRCRKLTALWRDFAAKKLVDRRTLMMMAQTELGIADQAGDHQALAAQGQVAAIDPSQGLTGESAARWVAQLIATHGGDRVALTNALRSSRMLRHRDVYVALQQQLGNEQAMHVMMAANNPDTAPPPPRTTIAGRDIVTSAVLTEAIHRDVFGVRITASAGCHPEVLDKAVAIVTTMVGNNEYAQRQLAKKQLAFVIVPADTALTALPEFVGLVGQSTFDGRPWEGVRGVGNLPTPDGRIAIAAGEETLIGVLSSQRTYGSGYSVGQHEFAHAVHLDGMTPEQRSRVTELYNARNAADPGNRGGTWSDQYADENEREYFAQVSNVFFGTNNSGTNKNGRAWLQQNDPGMYAFLVELYERKHDRKGRPVDDGR